MSRLHKYLNEGKIIPDSMEKIPKTKRFGFSLDNPGGNWLEREREIATKRKIGGSVTATFAKSFLIPTFKVIIIPGLQEEKRKLSEPRVQELMNSIKKEGIKTPIFINIDYKGKAYINEGNRRVLIADKLGLEWVPVEVRYYAGGERINRSWHPDKLVKQAKNWRG